MNKKIKTLLYIVGFLLFIGLAVFGYNYLTARYNAPNDLDVPPADDSGESDEPVMYLDFAALDYDGNTVNLSDYIGTPIVLNFWATWCSPCRSEMPDFNKVSQEYLEDELLFLMVDLADGRRETVEIAKEYIEEKNFTFPVLFDTERDAAIAYGVRAIPTTYLINKEGHVVWGTEGPLTEGELRQAITAILE